MNRLAQLFFAEEFIGNQIPDELLFYTIMGCPRNDSWTHPLMDTIKRRARNNEMKVSQYLETLPRIKLCQN